jgi:hypothetical protein
MSNPLASRLFGLPKFGFQNLKFISIRITVFFRTDGNTDKGKIVGVSFHLLDRVST